MTKVKKNFKVGKICIYVLIICLIMIFLSTLIYDTFGEYIKIVCIIGISSLLVIAIGYSIVEYIIITSYGTYSQKLQEIWQKIQKGARDKVFVYLKKNKDTIEISKLLQFASIYIDDNEMFAYLLSKIIELYNVSDIKIKSMISFFLLENEQNNEVAAIFKQNKALRNQCKKISQEMCNDIEQEFENLQEEVNEKKLMIFFQKLLHSCLPTNNISKENMINLLRFILGWILKNISKENIDAYEKSMLMFILLIPAIKNKLKKNNINDEDITKEFRKIENSEWFKDLLNKTFDYIDFTVKNNDKELVKNKNWLKYSCITSLYYEKLSFWKKLKIFYKIKNIESQLYKEYDFEKVAFFVLSASFIRVVKNNDDLIYNWLSLIYLCVSQYNFSFC